MYHPNNHDAKHNVNEMRTVELNHALHWAFEQEGSDEAMKQAWEESGYYSWPLRPAGWDTVRLFRTWEESIIPAFVQLVINKYLYDNFHDNFPL